MTTDTAISSSCCAEMPATPRADGYVPRVARKSGAALFAGIVPWLRRGPRRSTALDFGHVGRLPEDRGRCRHPRSDEDVLRACAQALSWSADVPEAAICLDVHRGIVVLTGTVNHPHERAAAEMAIRDIDGVVSISNRVGLRPASSCADTAGAIRAAMPTSAGHGEAPVQVRVDGACVLLAGQVRSRREHRAILAAAWSVPIIVHVIDEIVVHSD